MSAEPKTHAGHRSILLGENALHELKQQKVRGAGGSRASWQESDPIFPSSIGTPFAKPDVERDDHAILDRAGLRGIRFHDLRHTAASLRLNHGTLPRVVSRILGHANSSVTLRIYAHSNLDMQTGAATLMDELVTPVAVDMRDLQPICNREVS